MTYVITVAGSGLIQTFIGAGDTFAAGYTGTLGVTVSDGSITYGQSEWILTSNGMAWLFTADMASLSDTITFTGLTAASLSRHIRNAGTSGDTLHWFGNDFVVGEDNLATWNGDIGTGSGIPSNLNTVEDAVTSDPTGLIVMAQGSANGLKSTDGAASWSTIGNLPSGVRHWFAFAGGAGTDSRWIAVSDGGYIYYTDDAWTSAPKDCRGNLLQISAIPHIDAVKVLVM